MYTYTYICTLKIIRIRIVPRNPRTTPTKSTINIASAKLGVVRILPFSWVPKIRTPLPQRYHLMKKVFRGDGACLAVPYVTRTIPTVIFGVKWWNLFRHPLCGWGLSLKTDNFRVTFLVFCFQPVDERQITHLICACLRYDLYDILRGVLGPFIQEKEQEASPKHP